MEKSLNYPQVSLARAFEDIKDVFRDPQQPGVPQQELLRSMGYNSLSGPARRRLSALRQYGLTVKSGDSERLTNLGRNLLREDDDFPDFAETAALRPRAFRNLWLQCGEAPAPEDALRQVLAKWHVTKAGTDNLIRSYVETLKFADMDAGGFNQRFIDAIDRHANDRTRPGERAWTFQFNQDSGFASWATLIGPEQVSPTEAISLLHGLAGALYKSFRSVVPTPTPAPVDHDEKE